MQNVAEGHETPTRVAWFAELAVVSIAHALPFHTSARVGGPAPTAMQNPLEGHETSSS
jgi:hypothetical protein